MLVNWGFSVAKLHCPSTGHYSVICWPLRPCDYICTHDTPLSSRWNRTREVQEESVRGALTLMSVSPRPGQDTFNCCRLGTVEACSFQSCPCWVVLFSPNRKKMLFIVSVVHCYRYKSSFQSSGGFCNVIRNFHVTGVWLHKVELSELQ